MVDLYDKFDVIVCGDDIKRSKPQPDIYLTAASKLGYKTEECVAFEDSFNGIKSAYTAGCKVIMVPDLDEPDEEAKKMLYAKVENIYDAKDILLFS